MCFSAPSRPRFAWLLWFALLLPLAQAAASCHVLSHWQDQRIARSVDQAAAAQGDPCDLCLTAADLAGGGASGTPLQVAQFELPHSVPVLRADGVWSAAVTPLYESRAPPFVSR
jgi:hypothetical protein